MPHLIRDGEAYTITEEDHNGIELDQVKPVEAPPVEIQGEPWGWSKPGPKPRGWREDNDYGPY